MCNTSQEIPRTWGRYTLFAYLSSIASGKGPRKLSLSPVESIAIDMGNKAVEARGARVRDIDTRKAHHLMVRT